MGRAAPHRQTTRRAQRARARAVARQVTKALSNRRSGNVRNDPAIYPKMSVLKVGFYRELLSFGFNVWACDADAVFMNDPRPMMREGAWAQADVAIATDCIDLPSDANYPLLHCDFNTGLVFMRGASEAVLRAHTERRPRANFAYWYPSWETWKFRRTLSYWIAIMYLEGSLLFIVGAAFVTGSSEEPRDGPSKKLLALLRECRDWSSGSVPVEKMNALPHIKAEAETPQTILHVIPSQSSPVLASPPGRGVFGMRLCFGQGALAIPRRGALGLILPPGPRRPCFPEPRV